MHETFWEEGTSVSVSCLGCWGWTGGMLAQEVRADVFPGEMLQHGQD